MKYIKKFILFSSFLFMFFNYSVFVKAATTSRTYTSQTDGKVVTQVELPENADGNIYVTTDNGQIWYYPTSPRDFRLCLWGGTPVETTSSSVATRTETKTITSSNKNASSSIDYNEGGFSGTLYKTKTETRETRGASKQISSFTVGSPYYHAKCKDCPRTYFYSEGGYEGTLELWYFRDHGERETEAYYDHAVYRGTVYKVTKEYTHYYSGTVKKADTSKTYTYHITISYDERPEPVSTEPSHSSYYEPEPTKPIEPSKVHAKLDDYNPKLNFYHFDKTFHLGFKVWDKDRKECKLIVRGVSKDHVSNLIIFSKTITPPSDEPNFPNITVDTSYDKHLTNSFISYAYLEYRVEPYSGSDTGFDMTWHRLPIQLVCKPRMEDIYVYEKDTRTTSNTLYTIMRTKSQSLYPDNFDKFIFTVDGSSPNSEPYSDSRNLNKSFIFGYFWPGLRGNKKYTVGCKFRTTEGYYSDTVYDSGYTKAADVSNCSFSSFNSGTASFYITNNSDNVSIPETQIRLYNSSGSLEYSSNWTRDSRIIIGGINPGKSYAVKTCTRNDKGITNSEKTWYNSISFNQPPVVKFISHIPMGTNVISPYRWDYEMNVNVSDPDDNTATLYMDAGGKEKSLRIGSLPDYPSSTSNAGFSFDSDEIPDGNYYIKFRAVDPNGGTGYCSSPEKFIVDNVAPRADIFKLHSRTPYSVTSVDNFHDPYNNGGRSGVNCYNYNAYDNSSLKEPAVCGSAKFPDNPYRGSDYRGYHTFEDLKPNKLYYFSLCGTDNGVTKSNNTVFHAYTASKDVTSIQYKGIQGGDAIFQVTQDSENTNPAETKVVLLNLEGYVKYESNWTSSNTIAVKNPDPNKHYKIATVTRNRDNYENTRKVWINDLLLNQPPIVKQIKVNTVNNLLPKNEPFKVDLNVSDKERDTVEVTLDFNGKTLTKTIESPPSEPSSTSNLSFEIPREEIPEGEFYVKFIAVDSKKGKGEYKSNIKFLVDKTKPKCTYFKVKSLTPNTITTTDNYHDPSSSNCKSGLTKVEYFIKGNQSFMIDATKPFGDSNTSINTATFKNLKANTQYTMTVVATDKDGNKGEPVDLVAYTRAENSKIKSVSREPGSNKIKVVIDKDPRNGNIDSLESKITIVTDTGEEITSTDWSSSTVFTLDLNKIKHDKKYRVLVKTRNGDKVENEFYKDDKFDDMILNYNSVIELDSIASANKTSKIRGEEILLKKGEPFYIKGKAWDKDGDKIHINATINGVKKDITLDAKDHRSKDNAINWVLHWCYDEIAENRYEDIRVLVSDGFPEDSPHFDSKNIDKILVVDKSNPIRNNYSTSISDNVGYDYLRLKVKYTDKPDKSWVAKIKAIEVREDNCSCPGWGNRVKSQEVSPEEVTLEHVFKFDKYKGNSFCSFQSRAIDIADNISKWEDIPKFCTLAHLPKKVEFNGEETVSGRKVFGFKIFDNPNNDIRPEARIRVYRAGTKNLVTETDWSKDEVQHIYTYSFSTKYDIYCDTRNEQGKITTQQKPFANMKDVYLNRPPELFLDNPTEIKVLNPDGSLTLTGKVSDPDQNQVIKIIAKIGSVEKIAEVQAPCEKAKWTLHWNEEELEEGDFNNFSIKALDPCNATDVKKFNRVIVDYTPPTSSPRILLNNKQLNSVDLDTVCTNPEDMLWVTTNTIFDIESNVKDDSIGINSLRYWYYNAGGNGEDFRNNGQVKDIKTLLSKLNNKDGFIKNTTIKSPKVSVLDELGSYKDLSGNINKIDTIKSEGYHTIVVAGADHNGNLSELAYTTVGTDYTKPIITDTYYKVYKPGANTVKAFVQAKDNISGVCKIQYELKERLNGTTIDSGSFEYSPDGKGYHHLLLNLKGTSKKPNITYALYTKVTDRAGNISEVKETIIEPNYPPQIEIYEKDKNWTVGANSIIVLRGRVKDLNKGQDLIVSLLLDKKSPKQKINMISTGDWQEFTFIVFSNDLAEGNYKDCKIQVEDIVEDDKGEVSEDKYKGLILIDKQAPSLDTPLPIKNKTMEEGKLDLEFTMKDAMSGIDLVNTTIDGQKLKVVDKVPEADGIYAITDKSESPKEVKVFIKKSAVKEFSYKLDMELLDKAGNKNSIKTEVLSIPQYKVNDVKLSFLNYNEELPYMLSRHLKDKDEVDYVCVEKNPLVVQANVQSYELKNIYLEIKHDNSIVYYDKISSPNFVNTGVKLNTKLHKGENKFDCRILAVDGKQVIKNQQIIVNCEKKLPVAIDLLSGDNTIKILDDKIFKLGEGQKVYYSNSLKDAIVINKDKVEITSSGKEFKKGEKIGSNGVYKLQYLNTNKDLCEICFNTLNSQPTLDVIYKDGKVSFNVGIFGTIYANDDPMLKNITNSIYRTRLVNDKVGQEEANGVSLFEDYVIEYTGKFKIEYKLDILGKEVKGEAVINHINAEDKKSLMTVENSSRFKYSDTILLDSLNKKMVNHGITSPKAIHLCNKLFVYGENGMVVYDSKLVKQNEYHDIGYCNAIDSIDSTVFLGTSKGLYLFKDNNKLTKQTAVDFSVDFVKYVEGNLFLTSGAKLYNATTETELYNFSNMSCVDLNTVNNDIKVTKVTGISLNDETELVIVNQDGDYLLLSED